MNQSKWDKRVGHPDCLFVADTSKRAKEVITALCAKFKLNRQDFGLEKYGPEVLVMYPKRRHKMNLFLMEQEGVY
jgi:hypothetical protein